MTIDVRAAGTDTSSPLPRPFANPAMIYKHVETPRGEAVFTIDPWTRRWGILQPNAVRFLQLANGRRTFAEIAEALAADTSLPPPSEGYVDMSAALEQVGLLSPDQGQQRANGLPVYNKSDIIGFHLEITNSCNMTCAHCYVSSGKKLPNELSFDEIIATIDQLPPFSGKHIAISGGEPRLRRDCQDIVEYAAVTCGHDVDLYTNGKGFPEALAQRILAINEGGDAGRVKIQLSLEGASAATHDLVRGRGSFELALRSLAMFQRTGANRSVTLFVCLTKNNIHEVDALIALADRFDVETLYFSQWQRQGNASDTPWATIAPEVEDWVAVGEKILRYDNPRLALWGNLFGDVANTPNGQLSLDSPLFPKHTYFYNVFPRITPDGHVFADQLWVDEDWSLGNVRSDSIDACFETPKFYDQLAQMRERIHQVKECQACEWKHLCECGSPGHTYAEYGHMNKKDLFCDARIYWFNRYVEHQVEQVMRP